MMVTEMKVSSPLMLNSCKQLDIHPGGYTERNHKPFVLLFVSVRRQATNITNIQTSLLLIAIVGQDLKLLKHLARKVPLPSIPST